MNNVFRPAERRKAKLRLGIAGPAGSGKTLSALLIAYGITGDWGKIAVVDTEHGSGDLYAGKEVGNVKIGIYQIVTFDPPYTPDRYVQFIAAAPAAGVEMLILDGISHAWEGKGGVLDIQERASHKSGNSSYTAWREATPEHNKLVEAMLQSDGHIIATMRSKIEYVLEEYQNKRGGTSQKPIKVGMAPVQRQGMDYEFTTVFDLTHEHYATASKDRSSIMDGRTEIPTVELGREYRAWLEDGVEPPPPFRYSTVLQQIVDATNNTIAKTIAAAYKNQAKRENWIHQLTETYETRVAAVGSAATDSSTGQAGAAPANNTPQPSTGSPAHESHLPSSGEPLGVRPRLDICTPWESLQGNDLYAAALTVAGDNKERLAILDTQWSHQKWSIMREMAAEWEQENLEELYRANGNVLTQREGAA